MIQCQGEGCEVWGAIGITLLYAEDGMVPGTSMKRHKVLCNECRDKFLKGAEHGTAQEPDGNTDEPDYPF